MRNHRQGRVPGRAGWKKLFPLPVWAECALFLCCCGGLCWVFLHRLELWWPSYLLYALSTYLLIALCIRIPGAVQTEKRWVKNHPRVDALLHNEELCFKRKLYRKQVINFAYGIYKIAYGVLLGSAWIGADGIYNFAQALIQLFQILRRKKAGTMAQQWRSYRFCGGMILLLHLTLVGIVFQAVNWNRAAESGEIAIIATASFAFYKFISAVIRLIRDRRHPHPIDSSVRMLELSQAFFAIFSLQIGLLHLYGTGEGWEFWLNLATGCMTCLMTASIGVYMIRRANRELNALQEN